MAYFLYLIFIQILDNDDAFFPEIVCKVLESEGHFTPWRVKCIAATAVQKGIVLIIVWFCTNFVEETMERQGVPPPLPPQSYHDVIKGVSFHISCFLLLLLLFSPQRKP